MRGARNSVRLCISPHPNCTLIPKAELASLSYPHHHQMPSEKHWCTFPSHPLADSPPRVQASRNKNPTPAQDSLREPLCEGSACDFLTLRGIAPRVATLETFGLSSSPAARGSIPATGQA